jgi:hypothetical protein
MTDREKAFVMNGLRNHLRACALLDGMEEDRDDYKLARIQIRLGIPHAVLEETRREQQALLAQMMEIAHERRHDDN